MIRLYAFIISLSFAILATPAASQKLLWPGDAGYSGPRTCNVLDVGCVNKLTSSKPKQKRVVSKPKRPNKAIAQWDKRGQPEPVAPRVVEQTLPSFTKDMPGPAPIDKVKPPTETPRADGISKGWLALLGLFVTALAGVVLWSRAVSKPAPGPATDMVIIRHQPPGTVTT